MLDTFSVEIEVMYIGLEPFQANLIQLLVGILSPNFGGVWQAGLHCYMQIAKCKLQIAKC